MPPRLPRPRLAEPPAPRDPNSVPLTAVNALGRGAARLRRRNRVEGAVIHPLIVCYSRTGHTRALARRLAGALVGAAFAEIGCPRYQGGGASVYLRAGWDALRGARPEIDMPATTAGHELVLVGGPVWAGRPAPPLLTYRARRPSLPDRVGLFLTSGGGPPQTAALDRLAALLPAPETARLVLSEREVREYAAEDRVSAFVKALAA